MGFVVSRIENGLDGIGGNVSDDKIGDNVDDKNSANTLSKKSNEDTLQKLDTKLINRLTWKIPNALALVGSRAGQERNAMTTSWITQLSMEPVIIGIGVDNKAVTHDLITRGGSFTINLWDASSTRVFVKFSKPAIYTEGHLNGWGVRESSTGAPIFLDAIAWLDCVVRQAIDFGTHTLFAGELVDGAIENDNVQPASMLDTRMKYGGVKRR